MFSSRMLFGFVAAVVAAATVDPLLEGLSNRGFFGPGRFTDGSNAATVVAWGVAGVIAVVLIALTVHRMLHHEDAATRWLRRSTAQLDYAGIRRLLPAIFAMQMIVLFSMETLEQAVVIGHTFGGTIWMGAPVLASLLAHAIGCAVVTLGLARLLHALARRIADVVRYALGFTLVRRNLAPVHHVRTEPVELARLLEPLIQRLQGRAPPQPAV